MLKQHRQYTQENSAIGDAIHSQSIPLRLSLSPAWQDAREAEIVLKRAFMSSQPKNSHEHLQGENEQIEKKASRE